MPFVHSVATIMVRELAKSIARTGKIGVAAKKTRSGREGSFMVSYWDVGVSHFNFNLRPADSWVIQTYIQ